MSTRHIGRFHSRKALTALLFGGGDSDRDRLSWREMQPILLRSAGLVGLAVAVVAVVSEYSFVSEPHAQPQAQIMASFAPQAVPAATAKPVEAARPQAPAEVALVPSAEAMPAPERVSVAAPPAGSQSPDKPAAEPALKQAALAIVPDAGRFAVETPEPPRKKTRVWPENAVQCPRDWVAGDNGEDESACAPSPFAQDGAGPIDDPELQEAVAQRTTELAGLQVAPRVPQARPGKAPKPVKASSRARSKGKLGPPPKCGKKYPRWRYVNKVPTWYCK